MGSSGNAGTPAGTTRFIAALDGLRGIAVLLVVMHHAIMISSETHARSRLFAIATFGWVGVDLFFVLSGFLITGILIDTRLGPGYFGRFYVRRALRIFPLYYASLLILFFALPLANLASGREFRSNQAWYWTYLVNVLCSLHPDASSVNRTGHFWSLAVEEQFYLLWPAVVLLLDVRRLRAICLSAIAAAPFIRAGLLLGYNTEWSWVYTMLPTRVDPLAMGALLAIAARQGQMAVVAWWLRRLAGFAAIVVGVLFLHERSFGFWERDVQLFGYSAVSVLAGWGVAELTSSAGSPLLRRACEAPWLRWFGRYSYALYVIHMPLMYVVRDNWQLIADDPRISLATMPGRLAFMLLTLAVSTGMAYLAWFAIERPFLRLKRLFPYAAN